MVVRELCFLVLVATVVTCMESGERLIIEERLVRQDRNAEGDYPFLVSFYYKGNNNEGPYHKCNGALIVPSWVLTTARCFDDDISNGLSNVSNWDVKVGMDQRSAEYRQISQITKHFDYWQKFGADLAFIKLNESVNRVTVAKYNNKSSCPDESGPAKLIVMKDGYPSNISVQATQGNECSQIGVENRLCLVTPSHQQRLCNEYLGSPVLASCDGTQSIVGIASACDQPEGKFLSVRVSVFKYWIETITKYYK